MLVLKLLLTPLLIGLISLADRRWGAQVGGWLVGLPLTSAPVSFFLALELGTPFAAHLALGVLLGLISQAVFCLTYGWLSLRLNWLGSWLLGWGAFGAATVVFDQIALPLPLVFLGVMGALVLALVLWPPAQGQGVATPAPGWALPGRMGLATATVLVLTSSASLLGPHLSGLLSPLPIFATVFAVFAHKLQGGRPARQILHGVVVSSFACAVFFLVVAIGIEQWSLGATFGAAAVAALLTQGALLGLVRRHPARREATRYPEMRTAPGISDRWSCASAPHPSLRSGQALGVLRSSLKCGPSLRLDTDYKRGYTDYGLPRPVRVCVAPSWSAPAPAAP